MKGIYRSWVAGGVLVLWTGALWATTSSPQEVAARAATALKGNLMAALGKALAEGGVPEAVRVCSQSAMEITEQSGKVDPAVVAIDRRTDRWRNPANRPDAADTKALAVFRDDKDKQDWLVEESEEVIRYYQPLRTAAACLQCHGEPQTFSPELKSLLKETYPDDRATGFKEGDLRGVIRVRVNRKTLTANFH